MALKVLNDIKTLIYLPTYSNGCNGCGVSRQMQREDLDERADVLDVPLFPLKRPRVSPSQIGIKTAESSCGLVKVFVTGQYRNSTSNYLLVAGAGNLWIPAGDIGLGVFFYLCTIQIRQPP